MKLQDYLGIWTKEGAYYVALPKKNYICISWGVIPKNFLDIELYPKTALKIYDAEEAFRRIYNKARLGYTIRSDRSYVWMLGSSTYVMRLHEAEFDLHRTEVEDLQQLLYLERKAHEDRLRASYRGIMDFFLD